MRDGKERLLLPRPKDDKKHWIFSLAFSPDGATLASTGSDGAIRLSASRAMLVSAGTMFLKRYTSQVHER